jgi:N-acetylneuraminic acid mutarotase
MRNGQPLDTAERYFPATGTWVAAGRLNLPRTEGSLTLLQDGRVLAAGGGIEGAPGWAATASAEIFDPASGEWSIAAAMEVARANATVTLLADGEVLVAGGESTFEASGGSVTATAEAYSPRLNSWRAAGSMTKPRYSAGSVLLPDGRVLVAGGWYSEKASDKSHNTTEIFNPATGLWTAAAPMTSPRAQHALVNLPDGRVLAVGGVDTSNKIFIGTEMYDPATGTWRPTQPLGLAVILPAVQVLLDGRVLVAGGGLNVSGTKLTAACQVYSPAAR